MGFSFPAANVLLGVVMLAGFYMADMEIVHTFPVARMAALSYFSPKPLKYLWEVNIDGAPIDRSRILFYTDFYEHLLQVFPSLTDAYGVLGFCYHYLGDDTRAIDDLKKAIAYDPLYIWNYYNLAAIYINQSRYQEASDLLKEVHFLDPKKNFIRVFRSKYIYTPLIAIGGKNNMADVLSHLALCIKVSNDLLQLLIQVPDSEAAQRALKRMKLELYVF